MICPPSRLTRLVQGPTTPRASLPSVIQQLGDPHPFDVSAVAANQCPQPVVWIAWRLGSFLMFRSLLFGHLVQSFVLIEILFVARSWIVP